jgi:hypothetical protein
MFSSVVPGASRPLPIEPPEILTTLPAFASKVETVKPAPDPPGNAVTKRHCDTPAGLA